MESISFFVSNLIIARKTRDSNKTLGKSCKSSCQWNHARVVIGKPRAQQNDAIRSRASKQKERTAMYIMRNRISGYSIIFRWHCRHGVIVCMLCSLLMRSSDDVEDGGWRGQVKGHFAGWPTVLVRIDIFTDGQARPRRTVLFYDLQVYTLYFIRAVVLVVTWKLPESIHVAVAMEWR